MRHTFKLPRKPKPAPSPEDMGEGAEEAAPLADTLYLFDMSDGVEALLRNVYDNVGRGGSVVRFRDMSPEKQAEMRRLYESPRQ